MQIMKHLITTVGEPKMKGRGGAERGGRGGLQDNEAAGERGLWGREGERERAGNKGVEQEEERMGEEKGREDVKGREGRRRGEVKAREQIARQWVFCFICVAVNIEGSRICDLCKQRRSPEVSFKCQTSWCKKTPSFNSCSAITSNVCAKRVYR